MIDKIEGHPILIALQVSVRAAEEGAPVPDLEVAEAEVAKALSRKLGAKYNVTIEEATEGPRSRVEEGT